MARAIATRCCSPPDIWTGRWWARSAKPDLFQCEHGPPAALAGLHAPVEQRGLDVAERGEVGDEVELLEDEADRVAPELRPVRVVERGHVDAADADRLPSLGRSRQPRSPSIVDLPDPDGPTIDTKSPAPMLQRHVA